MTGKLLKWCLLCLLTVTVAPTYAQDEAQVCNDVPAPRLVLTEQARVTPGDPNRVRDFPSPDGALLESIPGEGEFTVINGPVCSAGFYWWFVDYNGQMGWTVEGNGVFRRFVHANRRRRLRYGRRSSLRSSRRR